MNIQELRFGSGTLSKSRDDKTLEHLLVEITLVINKGENSLNHVELAWNILIFWLDTKWPAVFDPSTSKRSWTSNMNEGSRMMRKNSQWMIHSFHVLKIGLKNTTLRAQFFTLLFFHLLCPLWILGWELFFKKNFHYSIFTNSFQHFLWAWLNRKNTKNDWNTTPFYFKKPLVNSILKAWNVRLMHYCYKPFVATCITTNNYFVGGIECLMHFMATKEGGS